jgi:hypothetical protein
MLLLLIIADGPVTILRADYPGGRAHEWRAVDIPRKGRATARNARFGVFRAPETQAGEQAGN